MCLEVGDGYEPKLAQRALHDMTVGIQRRIVDPQAIERDRRVDLADSIVSLARRSPINHVPSIDAGVVSFGGTGHNARSAGGPARPRPCPNHRDPEPRRAADHLRPSDVRRRRMMASARAHSQSGEAKAASYVQAFRSTDSLRGRRPVTETHSFRGLFSPPSVP